MERERIGALPCWTGPWRAEPLSGGLSNEIRQKLERHRPQTIGQASRIQGMTPAAISILLVYLKRAELASDVGAKP